MEHSTANPFSTIFFDLDDTLYPSDTGVWDAIGERINQFMIQKVGLEEKNVAAIRDELWHEYGTTLRGLQVLYGIDPADYLAYVHDVPLGQFLSPQPGLRSLLAGLPQRKIIFTNADTNHARRVLQILEIGGCFEQIIDVQATAPYCKPMPQALQRALQLAGETAEHCVFVEDSARNLATARELGLYTILVGRDDPQHAFNAAIPSILDLRRALPG